MTDPFLFGMEWECALGSADPAATPMNREAAFQLLRQCLRELSPWLPDGGNGIYTPSFRFYQDSGQHPEASSVEVTSPRQFLELKEVIFSLLAQAVQRAREKWPGLVLLVNNHDYLHSTYWGCHESYALSCTPSRLADGMLPFLASRHLLAGNGRIDRRGRVLFSSRAQAMRHITGGATTGERALYSTCRDEPLMKGGPFSHRLHLICGDALLSQLGEYLKVATTALVLAWLQQEPVACNDLKLESPLRLLKAANVLWRPSGRVHICETALALQQTYCQRVERFVNANAGLPAWCGEAVGLWQETLQLLRTDPLALTDRLDPFIKLTLYDAALRHLGRRWCDIAGDRTLFHQLALVDLAYHRVGEDGPFERMDRQGHLQHRIVASPNGKCGPLEFVRQLPTRAAARAEWITALSGQPGVVCGWTYIYRLQPPGSIDLNDPTRRDRGDWQDRSLERLPFSDSLMRWLVNV